MSYDDDATLALRNEVESLRAELTTLSVRYAQCEDERDSAMALADRLRREASATFLNPVATYSNHPMRVTASHDIAATVSGMPASPSTTGGGGGGDPRLTPALALIERAGLVGFEWYAASSLDAFLTTARRNGDRFSGTGPTPTEAVLSLAEAALDGHPCPACNRATAIDTMGVADLPEKLAGDALCWVTYAGDDFLRDCGGFEIY